MRKGSGFHGARCACGQDLETAWSRCSWRATARPAHARDAAEPRCTCSWSSGPNAQGAPSFTTPARPSQSAWTRYSRPAASARQPGHPTSVPRTHASTCARRRGTSLHQVACLPLQTRKGPRVVRAGGLQSIAMLCQSRPLPRPIHRHRALRARTGSTRRHVLYGLILARVGWQHAASADPSAYECEERQYAPFHRKSMSRKSWSSRMWVA